MRKGRKGGTVRKRGFFTCTHEVWLTLYSSASGVFKWKASLINLSLSQLAVQYTQPGPPACVVHHMGCNQKWVFHRQVCFNIKRAGGLWSLKTKKKISLAWLKWGSFALNSHMLNLAQAERNMRDVWLHKSLTNGRWYPFWKIRTGFQAFMPLQRPILGMNQCKISQIRHGGNISLFYLTSYFPGFKVSLPVFHTVSLCRIQMIANEEKKSYILKGIRAFYSLLF